jgi:uncharacterized protein
MARPERTCIGCRTRREQDELVRLVAADGVLVVAGQSAGGRGAYVCPEPACLDAAAKRRAFAYALRQQVQIDGRARVAFARACAERKAVV